jgi:hypothetical protein
MYITQEMYNAHFKKYRTLYVKVEILNSQDKVVDRLEGVAIDGSVDIQAESLIRRTGNISFLLKSNLIPTPSSPLWINNKIRLWIGIDYLDSIQYFNLGIFIFSNPNIIINNSDRTISLSLYDKMYKFEKTPLELTTKFTVGTPIPEVLKSVVQTLGGENKLLINSNSLTLPYDLEFSPDETILNVIEKIQGLYMQWQCYYDENGRFIYEEIPNRLNDEIIWNFEDNTDFRINNNQEIKFDNIYNYFKIIGKTKDDGTFASAIVQNTNVNSPFAIAKIGKKALVIQDDNYYENEQCTQYGNYLKYKHGNFNELASFSMIPVFYFDVNKIIEFNSLDDNLIGKYCISNLSVSLKYDGEMNVIVYKIYE